MAGCQEERVTISLLLVGSVEGEGGGGVQEDAGERVTDLAGRWMWRGERRKKEVCRLSIRSRI